MSKIKLISIAALGLIVINLILIGFLFFRKPPMPPGGKPPFGNDGPKNIIIEKLHFDKEQSDLYQKLINEHRSSIKEKEDSIRIIKNDLYRTLSENNISAKDSLLNKLGVLQIEIENIHYNHFYDIKKLCRPDQVIFFDELAFELSEFFSPGQKNPTHLPQRR